MPVPTSPPMADEDRAVAALMRRAAREAILPRFRKLADHERREKAPGDVVTDADEAAEATLAEGLRALAPDAVVVGEEAAAADPRLLEGLTAVPDLWFVDPLDGTANFAAGIPMFATMVARVRRGRTTAAWIYDPLANSLLWAREGAGAWREDRRVVVPAPVPLASMAGVMTLRSGDRPTAARIVSRIDRIGSTMQLRCAGHEYAHLAEGRLHFAFYRRLMPWDHAPGVLIHAEAGGHAAYVDGGPYRPDGPTQSAGLLIAPDAESWRALHTALLAP